MIVDLERYTGQPGIADINTGGNDAVLTFGLIRRVRYNDSNGWLDFDRFRVATGASTAISISILIYGQHRHRV